MKLKIPFGPVMLLINIYPRPMKTYTTDLHYLKIHFCEFICLLKFTCNPMINIQRAFTIICRYAQNGEKFEFPDMHILS